MNALNFRIIQSQPSTNNSDGSKESRLEHELAYQTRELSRLRQAAVRDPLTGGANMRSLAIALVEFTKSLCSILVECTPDKVKSMNHLLLQALLLWGQIPISKLRILSALLLMSSQPGDS